MEKSNFDISLLSGRILKVIESSLFFGEYEYDIETENTIKEYAKNRIKLLWERESEKSDDEIEEMRGGD